MKDFAEGVGWNWFYDGVNVIGHNGPCVEVIALALEELDRVGDHGSDLLVVEKAVSVSGVQVVIDAFGVPLEEFFLFGPGKWTFCSKCFLEDDFAFLLKCVKNIFGQSAELAESDEVGRIFAFEVGEDAAGVEAGGVLIYGGCAISRT